MKGVLRSAVACLAAYAISMPLFAAPAPSSPTPGQVQSTLPTQPAQPKKAPPPSANSGPTNVAGVAPGGPTFRINSFTIEGNSAIPTAELQAQIAAYVGKDMTLSQLYDVADVLTRYYRSKGYGLAYVAPPAQKLSAGNVRLQVVEGRIGHVSILGNDRTRTGVLARRTAGLNPGDTYTDAAAERAALLMNDIPGEQAHVTVSPGTEAGTSDLVFNVDERGYNGDVSLDNYGRDAIGRWRLSADADVNSLTGSGDQLSAGITHAEGNLLNFGKLGYLLPVGSSSSFGVNFNRAFYHVGGPVFGPLGIEGSTQNAGINWQYAEIRTQAQSLYWGVGVTHNTSKSEAGPVTTVTTNITLLQLTMLYNRQYADQSYYNLNGTLWTNGKSNSAGNLNDAEKFHFEFDGSYVKPFADVWDFIGQGSVAYSADTLVDGDKYSLGGPGNVRGFQSAEARGDRGLFGSVELQRTFVPSVKFPLAWGVFLDSGKAWTKAVGLIPASDETLTSIGTELQLLPSGTGWTARLQAAWAIGSTRPSDDTPDRTVHDVDRGPHLWFTLGKTF